MGMAVGAEAGLSSEPNLVPMIDVLLVLLVIFMLIVPMSRRVIDLQLPNPEPTLSTTTPPAQIVLEVLPGDVYKVNSTQYTLDQLAGTLKGIYDPRPDKIIFVIGDPTVTYQQVIGAMDIARGAGVRVIGIPPKKEAKAG